MKLRKDEDDTPGEILTIGHSTRSIHEFLEMLAAHDVRRVIDIRTIPRSRHNPQYNTEALAVSLKQSGRSYTHLPGLGGLRRPKPDSVNAGWRNDSFRGFADYMQTKEFTTALDELQSLAAKERVALMCAEAVPWRCHRSLVADALIARGIPVEHIMSAAKRQPHKLTPFAMVQGTCVTYPAEGVTPELNLQPETKLHGGLGPPLR